MRDRRAVEDLTIEELEQVLLLRRHQARLERLKRLGGSGRLVELPPPELLGPPPDLPPVKPSTSFSEWFSQSRFRPVQVLAREPQRRRRVRLPPWRKFRDQGLLLLELAAVAALLLVLYFSLADLRTLNQEVAQARMAETALTPTPTATAVIDVQILPGSRFVPTKSGSIPAHLRDLIEPVTQAPLPIPTPGPQAPTRLVIPSINVDAPVVEGDGWEELKKGAGHHIGSANPGERGNVVISAHNDIFGEIFRDLEDVDLDDEVLLYAGEQVYTYIVRAKRIVEPTEVSVMAPTSKPVLTLITCHPYLVDTHRLVVIAELKE